MGKILKKPAALLLSVFMTLTSLLPVITIKAATGNSDATIDHDDYISEWSMDGAEYAAYTSEEAARQALENVKAGKEAGEEGIATTVEGKNAIFTIGENNESSELALKFGDYWIVETTVPNGWHLDENIHYESVTETTGTVTVESTEIPKFYLFGITKEVSIPKFIDTDAYKETYPITGAQYVLFTDLADAEAIKTKLEAANSNVLNSDDDPYPKTIEYDSDKIVQKDEKNNTAILTVSEDGSTNQIWLDESQTYYAVEVTRPYGYYFDSTIHTLEAANDNGQYGGHEITETSTEKNANSFIKISKEWSRDSWVQEVANTDKGEISNYNLKINWVIYPENNESTQVASGTTNEDGSMSVDEMSLAEGVTCETDSDGNPEYLCIPLGTYVLKETAIAENSGKIYNDEGVTIELSESEDKSDVNVVTEQQLQNAPYTPEWENLLTKTIDENDEIFYDRYSLKGTQFKVYYFTDPTLNELFEQGDEGRWILKETMKEKANRTWTFEAKDDDKGTETFNLDNGGIADLPQNTIKYSNDYKIAGDDLFTNEEGNPVMLIGTYVFEEVKTTRGLSFMDSWAYHLGNNGDKTTIEEDDYERYDETTTVSNCKQTITIEIKKSSESENEENYFGSVAGAEFKLEYQDPLSGDWLPATAMHTSGTDEDASKIKINENGIGQSDPMKPGVYRIKELTPPAGHTLNHVEADGTIVKHGEPFELGHLTTENNGQRNFTFFYDASTVDMLSNLSTKNAILKVSYDDNSELQPLAGATLQLYEKNEDSLDLLKEWTSKEEATTFYGLKVGQEYRVVETAVPEGYLMPLGTDAYIDFTVEDNDAVHTFEFLNEKIPQLSSEATFATGLKELNIDTDEVILTDHFKAWDLLPNKEYTFSNIALRDLNDEYDVEDVTTAQSVATVDDVHFATDSVKADFDVVFDLSNVSLAPGKYVITGELHRDDRAVETKVAESNNLTDWNESITVVGVDSTFAFDNAKEETADQAQFILNDTQGIIKDKIEYRSAVVGDTYKILTKVVDEEGKEVASQVTDKVLPETATPDVVDNTDVIDNNVDNDIIDADIDNDVIDDTDIDMSDDDNDLLDIDDLDDLDLDIDDLDDLDIDDVDSDIPDDADVPDVDNSDIDVPSTDPIEEGVPNAEVSNVDAVTNGVAYVEIPIDAQSYNGHTLTVFEYIYKTGKDGVDYLVAQHEDINDTAQQVQIPEVITNADEIVVTSEEAQHDYWFDVIDKVEYNHIPANTQLVGTSTVVDKETGEPVTDENGNIFTNEEVFTTETGTYSYEAHIKVPYDVVEGRTVVLYNTLKTSDGDVDIARHQDIESADQTIHFPQIQTIAWFENNEGEEVILTKNNLKDQETFDIIDNVYLSNLEKDREYEVLAELYRVDAEGNYDLIQTSEVVPYTADDSAAELTVSLGTIENPNLAEGEKLVVMEYLKTDDKLVGKHFQTTDENQTVRIPTLYGNASDGADGDKYLYNNGPQKINYTLYYKDLTPGVEVLVDAYLVNQDGTPILDADGNEIRIQMPFTPEETNGEITLEFEIDGKYLEGQTITVFEDISENGKLVGTQHDLSEDAPKVFVAEVNTMLLDDTTKDHVALADKNMSITDTIAYRNLEPGKECKVIGKLAVDGTVIKDEKGTEITAEGTFTVGEESEGTADVTFKFDGTKFAGKSVVALEFITDAETADPVASHEELDDADQTVAIPKIDTKAKLASKYVDSKTKTVTVKDTVSYTNVPTGSQVTFVGTLMDADTGKVIKVAKGNRAPVAVTSQLAKESKGKAEVTFKVDADDVLGHKLVVFEKAYLEYGEKTEKFIARHEDIKDKAQTVQLPMQLTVNITKGDKANANHLLKGAEITLFNKDGSIARDQFGKKCVGVTNEKGQVQFVLMYKNGSKLYAKETKAPDGYHINADKFDVKPAKNAKYKAKVDIKILDESLVVPPTKTGDTNNLALWIVLLALSGLTTALIVVARKKFNN